MAPEPEDAGQAPPASSSAPQANARVRSRARNRDGPPQLQFLTATDLSQFKDEHAKRSVRSQAMIQYRYKSGQQERSKSRVSAQAERIIPITKNERPYQGDQNPLMTEVLDYREEEQLLCPSTSTAWWATNPEGGMQEPSWYPAQPTIMPSELSSRFYLARSTSLLNAAPKRVTDYEDSEDYEEVMMRMLMAELATLNHIGDGVDPFGVIPQFASPELDSLYLARTACRAFVSPATMVKWWPLMRAHPHIILSATSLTSTWLDMYAGCSGDSKRTVLVKGETIGFINERLRDPATQFEDITLMIVCHLLAGEMWSCDEKTMRIHEHGVAKLIAHRGGMGRLGGNGATAEVAAACCQHSDIICEAISLPIFQKWEPSRFAPFGASENIPESPLFCARKELYTIARDPRCSEFTYNLLCDMRDLTDLFLAYNYNRAIDSIIDDEDIAKLGPSSRDYDTKVADIVRRLSSLPSAYTPGFPVTDDFVYESCRIAAIIYASAIIMRVPFSIASEPGRSVVVADSASLTNSLGGAPRPSTRLPEALHEALEKSNTSDIWGDMAGVLYWVATVGAAAARTPDSINMSQAPRLRSEAYATWVRRCLIMFGTRVMVILIFEHPTSIVMAQKKLLKVQELIGSGHSRQLT